MLRVKDNNVSFAKGESVCLEFQIAMNNGMPFVMPNVIDEFVAVLAFTVKAGISDEIVLARYLNLRDIAIYSGYADISDNGYCKFVSQDPKIFDKILDMYNAYGYEPNSDGVNTNTEPTLAQLNNRKYIAYCKETDNYYCWAQIDNSTGRIVVYTFEFQLPIFPKETQNLDSKEYVYDVCAYIGKYGESNTGFPLETIDWKMQLLKPHKLTLEDSNNV